MKRLLYQELIEWKDSVQRKPLIIQGARQVGKTFLIQEFAKRAYQDHIYCNFEEDPFLKELFRGKLDPDALVESLGFYRGKKITPETLIIFDEIQVVERAITSLKYFCEKAKQYHVIAAGSLLGVSMGQQVSFPVGKVTFLSLFPLNFIEYLQAIGEPMLAELLLAKNDFSPLPVPLHEKLSNYFKVFLYIGGMPEVVNHYATHKDIAYVAKIQRDIHQAYANDFSKYAAPLDSMKISNIWQSIPFQLAKENKKFKFSDMEKGGRYSKYELALEWLRKAGLIHLAYNVSTAKIPIKGYCESNKFKLYYLDTGLLASRLNLSSQLIILGDSLFTEYKGALIENYIAKEIRPQQDEYLYYWTSKSAAEIDFLVEFNQKIIPIEVKSGLSQYKKSLVSFQKKYQPEIAIRFSPRNFIKNEWLINLPLYSACLLTRLL